jgi:SAM-dependent methyltransferase
MLHDSHMIAATASLRWRCNKSFKFLLSAGKAAPVQTLGSRATLPMRRIGYAIMNVCRICGNADGNAIHLAREMMLGLGDVFEYLECANCGCLQIKDIPDNLSKYYPKNYYSYEQSSYSRLGSYLRSRRTAYKLYGASIIGMWMSMLAGDYSSRSRHNGWFSRAGISRESRILDVGCGSGKLLRRLRELGFTNLTGLDPFIEHDIRIDDLTIYKRNLAQLQGSFDFVMFHHSFEHMPEPLDALKRIRQFLDPGSYALIRIPVAADAWRIYGVNWVQLDAPRHLYLHTVDSMRIIAEQAGLQIAEVVFDSTSYQFLGSEGYARRQLAVGEAQDASRREPNPKPQQRMREFRRKSEELNEAGRGDQACFYLRCA